jgi:Immunity protein 42
MIYGDPFRFALQFDVVEAWNVQGNEWRNGVFAAYVDGERLFALVDVVELRTTFDFFKRISFEEIKFGSINISAVDVFRNAYKYFLNDGEVLSEGIIDLTCTAMEDSGLNLYLLKTIAGERIIWSWDGGITVSEYRLDAGFFASVIDCMPLTLCRQ